MSTGSQIFGRPSLGAWTLYGLGSESKDLPGYVVFSTGSKDRVGATPIGERPFLPPIPGSKPGWWRSGPLPLELVSGFRDATRHRRHGEQTQPASVGHRRGSEIATRIDRSRWPTGCRPALRTPWIGGRNPKKPWPCTGPSRAKPPLPIAVCWHGVWSSAVCVSFKSFTRHGTASGNLVGDLKRTAAIRSSVCGADSRSQEPWVVGRHVGDLGRGAWPHADGSRGEVDGRDHHPNAFTMWMAGGGVKAGLTLGETDELRLQRREGQSSCA